MQLAALKRWHWVAIALVAGLAIGVTQIAFNSGVSGIQVDGATILTDQQAFENALVQVYQPTNTRLFTDATIYTHEVTDGHGAKKWVDVVKGSYAVREEEGGVARLHWAPRSFVAYRPYKPTIGVPGPDGTAPQTQYPSVEQFLAAMHAAYGVNYTHAWWANRPVLTWLITSVVVIGGIWPTLINLLTFGTFTRPAEAKGLSLWKVRAPAPARPAGAPAAVSMPDSPPDEELEQSTAGAAQVEEEPAEEAVARVLAGGPIELAPEQEKEAHEYTAKADDFYPTERRTHPANGSHPR